MAKRISPEQIETARNAFRGGWSIPEAASIANMSKASFHKYLRQDIETYMQEHLASKEAKLKPIETEIKPAPSPEPIEDEQNSQNAISELSLNQFRQYVETEFNSIGKDQLALKQMFYELKAEHEQDYDRLIVVRECYDNALSQLVKPKPMANSKVQRGQNDPFVKPNDLAQNRLQSIKDAIQAHKSRFNCRIPVPRDLANWNDERLMEHITYHVARGRKHTHKEALQICLLPIEQKQEWLEQQLP